MARLLRKEAPLDPGFWTTTSWIQLLYGVWVNMAQLGIGLAFGFPAVQVPQLSSPESDIRITRDDASWIASVLTLFSPIGCLISGILMDKYGRKLMLIICQGPMCIGWLYTGLAATSKQIIIGRAITGIGCGMAMGPPRIFATEVSLPNMRGVIGAFPALAMSLGISMQAGLGGFFEWHILCFVCSAFTFCNLLMFNLLPETPYFILIKGTAENARKTLAKFRGKKYDIDSEMLQLIEFKADNKIRKLKMKEKIHILFTRGACKPFSLINTYILVSQAAGISVILIWAIEILKTANSSFDVHSGNFLMALTRLFVGICTSILLFRVGRKPLAMSSAVGVTIVCLSLGLFIHYNDEPTIVPQMGFMAYMAFATLGYYTLPFLMMSELYPLQVRGTLGGITVSLTSFLIFGTTKMFPYVRDRVGLSNTIILFGICSLFGTIFIYFFLPETKDLTLQEIEEYYNARRSTLVSQRRVMSMQIQHSERSIGPAKSKDALKSSLEKFKTDHTITLNMSKKGLKKSRSLLLIKKTAVTRSRENTTSDKTAAPPPELSFEAIKSKLEILISKENLNAKKAKKKIRSEVNFLDLKRKSSPNTSDESFKKYLQQESSHNSKESLREKIKFRVFDEGPEKKLVIHSDESMSFYILNHDDKEPSPEKEESSRKAKSLSVEPAENEKITMKEPKRSPSYTAKQNPDTDTGSKEKQSPEQEQVANNKTELSNLKLIDTSKKQGDLYKTKESLIKKEDNTKTKTKDDNNVQKKVTIDSEGSYSGSDESIASNNRSKGKEDINKEDKSKEEKKDEGGDDYDINKPSTSKSSRR